MSDSYYLVCKTHKKIVYFNSNKIEDLTEKEKENLRDFLIHHGCFTGCKVILQSEHDIDSKLNTKDENNILDLNDIYKNENYF